MKIGAENKKSVIVMVVLIVVAIAFAVYRFKGLFSGGSASAAPSVSSATSAATQPAKPPAGAASQPNTANTRLLLDVLHNSRNVKYQEGRNIFSMEAVVVPPLDKNPRTTPTPIPTPTGPTPTPTPPPIPLKYYGFASKPGEPKKIFLQEPGGEVFVASEGQIVARRFRVVQIQANSVTMEDVITGNRQPVQLTVR